MGKLTRKEKVEKCLKELTLSHFNAEKSKGFQTDEIAKILELNRSNVSKELNQLIQEEKIIKLKGKPVYYLHKESIENMYNVSIQTMIFDSIDDIFNFNQKKNKDDIFQLIGSEGSLKASIERAKAAVIYPPKGLSTLIIGPTGVGKSMFAEYMYKYGVKVGQFEPKAPFIVFNCADYSENQSLLLSQLFGYVKGAFTGADKDKEGLVDSSNNGILFLDEVHRLSAEGQEMLFLLMDKGVYRRLGEVKATHKSNVMIIAATTENPETVMLETFLRRIPVVIKLPTLKQRPLLERMELICHFFNMESVRVHKKVLVSKEVIKAFLFYECSGNIGQLKSDIQLICARAFLDCMTYNKEAVEVKLSLLSGNVQEGLYNMDSRGKLVHEVQLLGRDSIEFYPDSEYHLENQNLIMNQKYNLNFYNMIQTTWEKLKKDGKSDSEIRKYIDRDIQKYSFNLMNIFLYNNDTNTAYEKIITQNIEYIVRNNLLMYDEWNQKSDVEKLVKAITLHIQNILERIRSGNIAIHPQADELIKERAFESEVSKRILDQVSQLYQVEIPKDELVYLASFLYLTNKERQCQYVGILVIMHGKSTASSMVSVANKLLGTEHAVAIDMDLDDRVQDVMMKAIDIAPSLDMGKGILLLTDMGSILTFAKVISDAVGISVKAMDMVSTPVLIEATRYSLNPDMTLDSLYEHLKKRINCFDESKENKKVIDDKH